MNDQLIMDNYLLLLKSTVEVYVHGTLESLTVDVRELLNNCLNSIIASQASTYDEMVDYGWYKVTNVETNKINQTLTKVQKCK